MRMRDIIIGLIAFYLILHVVAFLNFASKLPVTENIQKKADAIVVFTGGTERIEKGVELLKSKRAQMLFISGVRPKLNKENIASLRHNARGYLECCVVIDEKARNTIENAAETTKFLRDKQIKSLYLVTSNYHMQRAVAELKFSMPEALIYPVSVVPQRISTQEWWKSLTGWKLLTHEYIKLTAAYFRHDLLRIGFGFTGL